MKLALITAAFLLVLSPNARSADMSSVLEAISHEASSNSATGIRVVSEVSQDMQTRFAQFIPSKYDLLLADEKGNPIFVEKNPEIYGTVYPGAISITKFSPIADSIGAKSDALFQKVKEILARKGVKTSGRLGLDNSISGTHLKNSETPSFFVREEILFSKELVNDLDRNAAFEIMKAFR